MITNHTPSFELIALAKDLNRQICDLNEKVAALRARLFDAAREAKALERAHKCSRKHRPAQLRDQLGQFESIDADAGMDPFDCHMSGLPHDARE